MTLKAGASILMAIVLSGCSGEVPKTREPAEKEGPRGPVEELTYSRTGGGQLQFSVLKADEGFRAHVTRYSFKTSDVIVPAQSYESKRVLEAVFSGKEKLTGAPRPENPDRLEGTWVSAQVRRGTNWCRISNQSVVARLGALEDDVRGQLEKLQPGGD